MSLSALVALDAINLDPVVVPYIHDRSVPTCSGQGGLAGVGTCGSRTNPFSTFSLSAFLRSNVTMSASTVSSILRMDTKPVSRNKMAGYLSGGIPSMVARSAKSTGLNGLYRKFRSGVRRALFGEHIFLDRLVLYQETDKLIAPLPVRSMDALEISGDRWASHGFRSYVSANYPDYDVCVRPLAETFDIIIAEQVFEHLLWPHRAAKNVFAMLRPGGYFFLATPFLLRVHEIPVDCSRWTETGLKYLLADSGFNLEDIKTGSWGNVSAAKANLRRNSFPAYYRHVSDLKNDPMFPVQVWALARKA